MITCLLRSYVLLLISIDISLYQARSVPSYQSGIITELYYPFWSILFIV